ncbi:helix-turn-helix domain-containing protein [Streptomyces wedmorensis]|uniref:helix-turn-helix domain-containing protein n=1 Tax=Streptomyces wedmorensis TaxID=43759 RepID=UPI0037952B50
MGRWTRELCLQGCRRELSGVLQGAGGASGAGATPGAVARRWGFTGPAAFARAFRREYGMSPTEWLRGERSQHSPQGPR